MPEPTTPEPTPNLWQAAHRALRKLGDDARDELELDLLADEDFVRDEPERPN